MKKDLFNILEGCLRLENSRELINEFDKYYFKNDAVQNLQNNLFTSIVYNKYLLLHRIKYKENIIVLLEVDNDFYQLRMFNRFVFKFYLISRTPVVISLILRKRIFEFDLSF